MDFTFGICATQENSELHGVIAESIECLEIENYEIIFIGNGLNKDSRYKVIDFDDSDKSGWITKKKNILVQNSSFENIVIMHDYFVFQPGWYTGFLKFGENFQVAMNKILNYDGQRFRDWCLNPYDVIPPTGPIENREFLLPYDVNLTSKMYISGSYWVAKTRFMLENPLDEELAWGQSEDMAWSNIVRKKIDFKMNTNSIVQSLKPKYCDFTEISADNLAKLRSA